jgi:hypothetical protein
MKLMINNQGVKVLKVEKSDFKAHARTGRPFQVETLNNLPQTNRMTNETLDTVVALLELETHLERSGDDIHLLAFRALDREKVKAQSVNILPPTKEHLQANTHIREVIPKARQGEVYDL